MLMVDRAPPSEIFIPDLCGIRAVFVLVVIAQLLAFLLTFARAGFNYPALYELALLSWYVQSVGLSAATVLCLARGWLKRLPEPSVAILSYGLILLSVAVVAEIVWWGVKSMLSTWGLIDIGHMDFLARTMGITAIVAALTLRYFYIQFHWQQRVASEARARLQALQARIRPHFLFNCMNTIASLTRSDPVRAERAVEDLADLFRASLSETQSLVTLNDELVLARGYLEIEHLRLGSRLSLTWAIDDLPLQTKIPQLTLQPLLENAIYHGIEPLAEGGMITIEGRMRDNEIEIAISNPINPRRDPHSGNQLAQDNVRQRLAAHFGGAGRLLVEVSAETYQVRVQWPLDYQPSAWLRDS
jgi:two-component system, LytTR family, sensor histidine kinase AlgZ